MVDWVMPASEAKAVTEGNRRVMRVLGMISHMIFESAIAGQSHVFFQTLESEFNLVSLLDEAEIQEVLNILYDRGYSWIPIYKGNNRGALDGASSHVKRDFTRSKLDIILGYNIDWSGQYD